MWKDLRFAVRQLSNNLGFTGLVVLTVALGIGANTAIFSMVNGYGRPLAVPAPQQIVAIAAQTKGDETGFRFQYSYPALQDFRAQRNLLSDVFAYQAELGGVSAGGRAVQFLYSAVTGNFFTGLGVKPALGRLFLPGEGESSGGEPMVVLGYSFWQKRFGGATDIVGQQIRLNGRPIRVIGVVARDFHGLFAGAEMDGYVPLSLMVDTAAPGYQGMYSDRKRRPLVVYGRLNRGVSIAEAQSALEVVARRMEQQYPDIEQGIGVRVLPEKYARPFPLPFLADMGPLVRGFVLMLAAVVLALACLNVANLLLVRGAIRQREMAIRAALGSGRSRLIRQALTESALLALLGTLGGLVVGKWGSDAFAASIDLATDFPIHLDFSFDWSVFAYALIAAVVTGGLIGIWPAFRASRANAGAALHDGSWGDSAGPSRQRLRGLLIVGQVAGSLVLLIVAGLFARSLANAEKVDLGFKSDHLLNVRMEPLWAGYDEQRTNDFYKELERRVRALPGVESASLAFSVPMGYYGDGRDIYIEGRPEDPTAQPLGMGMNHVDSAYFATMGMPIVRGRAFTDSDTATSPRVAIVNETMAARYWPNQNPIGRRFRIGGPDAAMREIVGVAHDSKYLVVFETPLPYFYVPLSQAFMSMRVLQMRTSVPPESLALRVQQEIRALDPDVPVFDLQTMRQALAGVGGFLIFRIGTAQAGALGILGLILAVVGVYGVVSYGAAQRTREIGIRMALGAQPHSVLRLILRQGAFLVAGGVVIGVGTAIALSRVLRRFLQLVSATDPLTFTAVTFLLVVIALGACYIPARRAMKVDPMIALRHE